MTVDTERDALPKRERLRSVSGKSSAHIFVSHRI